jgi:DNA modification methylase
MSIGNSSLYLDYFPTYSLPYIEYFNKFVQISYLNQMPNNKKAWHIRELADKRPDNYSKYAFPYEVCANVLESSKYGDEFVGINYSSKCS